MRQLRIRNKAMKEKARVVNEEAKDISSNHCINCLFRGHISKAVLFPMDYSPPEHEVTSRDNSDIFHSQDSLTGSSRFYHDPEVKLNSYTSKEKHTMHILHSDLIIIVFITYISIL